MNCDEIEAQAKSIELKASLLPPGAKKAALAQQASNLRTYADMKRLLAPTRT